MASRSSLLLFVCLSCVAGTAWSAVRDTIKPGPITGLTAQQTIRAVTLRFTATGDDGTTGTVAGYDVRVKPLTGDCSGDPATWPVASHTAAVRNHGLMAAAGSTDFANVRELQPDMAYCFAIRAFDEVPNYSATWAVTSQSTLPGEMPAGGADWPVAGIPVPTSGTMPTAHVQTVALDEVSDGGSEPALLVSWLNGSLNTSVTPNVWVYGSVGFARVSAPSVDTGVAACNGGSAECYEQISLSNPVLSTYIDTIVGGSGSGTSVAAIPGPSGLAALLVRGTRKVGSVAQPRTLVLERSTSGTWSSQLVPNVEIVPGTATNLVYIPDQQSNPGADPSGVWNPAFTWERVDSVTSTTRAATLMLAERKSGVWTHSPLFARQVHSSTPIPSGNWLPAFRERHLFVKSGGTLGVYVAPLGTINGVTVNLDGVYAERSIDGSWSYFDAGPEFRANYGVAPIDAVGLDENGQLLIAASPYLSTDVGLIRQSSFAGPFSGLPSMNPSPLVTASAWATVFSQVIPDFGSATAVMGVYANVCTSGSVEIPILLTGYGARTYEARILSVRPDSTTSVVSGDRIDGAATNLGAVGMSNGDAALTYVWGRSPDFTIVARAHNGSCP